MCQNAKEIHPNKPTNEGWVVLDVSVRDPLFAYPLSINISVQLLIFPSIINLNIGQFSPFFHLGLHVLHLHYLFFAAATKKDVPYMFPVSPCVSRQYFKTVIQ